MNMNVNVNMNRRMNDNDTTSDVAIAKILNGDEVSFAEDMNACSVASSTFTFTDDESACVLVNQIRGPRRAKGKGSKKGKGGKGTAKSKKSKSKTSKSKSKAASPTAADDTAAFGATKEKGVRRSGRARRTSVRGQEYTEHLALI